MLLGCWQQGSWIKSHLCCWFWGSAQGSFGSTGGGLGYLADVFGSHFSVFSLTNTFYPMLQGHEWGHWLALLWILSPKQGKPSIYSSPATCCALAPPWPRQSSPRSAVAWLWHLTPWLSVLCSFWETCSSKAMKYYIRYRRPRPRPS